MPYLQEDCLFTLSVNRSEREDYYIYDSISDNDSIRDSYAFCDLERDVGSEFLWLPLCTSVSSVVEMSSPYTIQSVRKSNQLPATRQLRRKKNLRLNPMDL